MENLVSHGENINALLARYSVKFGIYKNGVFHEQLFPYDAIPRVIPADEFAKLEKGLIQRVDALNLYLADIYSGQQIVMDGIVPADDKGIYYFVPKMIRYYLNEEPILQNAPTYLPFYEDDMKYVMAHLETLVVKDVAEAGGYGVIFGRDLMECGRRLERLDLYLRLDYNYRDIEREFSRFQFALGCLRMPHDTESAGLLADYISQGNDHRLIDRRAIDCLERTLCLGWRAV